LRVLRNVETVQSLLADKLGPFSARSNYVIRLNGNHFVKLATIPAFES
jgi:hypothetical protein